MSETTIKLNVCTNEEILGVEDVRDRRNYQDAVYEAYDMRVAFLLIEPQNRFAYWSAGDGYGHGKVAVEIIGNGIESAIVTTVSEAKSAVAWLARKGKNFPSSAEIESAFEAKEIMEDGIAEAIQDAAIEATEFETT